MATRRAACAALLVALAAHDSAAIIVALDRPAMERALALARWPRTDAERARFHSRYVRRIGGPTVRTVRVDRIEIVTAFRYLELLGERHANDLFGRAGFSDVEDALRPWHGRLSIVAHLTFDLTTLITGIPDVVVELGRDGPQPLAIDRVGLYSNGRPGHAVLYGATIDARFAAAAVGNTVWPIVVRLNDKELARTIVNFAALE